MTTYRASCECGKLVATCQGAPGSIVQCHCMDCQKKTGSAFGLGAYFERSAVQITGVSTRFIRNAMEGRKFTQHFCSSCGTTLFWMTERHVGGIGIAVGCFDDLPDTKPVRSVFDVSRCIWLEPLDVPTFVKGRDSEQVK